MVYIIHFVYRFITFFIQNPYIYDLNLFGDPDTGIEVGIYYRDGGRYGKTDG